MRYLTRTFAVGAIGRGAVVGQLLGGYDDGARRGLRVLTIQPESDAYCLFVHEVEDTGGEDIAEFPPWSIHGGDPTVCSECPAALLSYAEGQLGADPQRWVDGCMLHDEYAEFVSAGRPALLRPPA